MTSANLGPRTMEHLDSQLGAPEGRPGDVLDKIDEIVPPGVNLNTADGTVPHAQPPAHLPGPDVVWID